MLTWKNVALSLALIGCLHFAVLAWRGHLASEVKSLPEPLPANVSADPNGFSLSYRKVDPQTNERQLNFSEGW